MSNNFSIDQFGFQKSLIDPPSNIGAKRDYTTSLKKDEVREEVRSYKNEERTSEQNKKFEEMMKSLKEKDNSQQDNKLQDNQDNKVKLKSTLEEPVTAPIAVPVQALLTKLVIDNTHLNAFQINAFQTEQAAVSVSVPVTDSKSDVPLDLLNIAALNEEIKELINEQTQGKASLEQIADITVTTKEASEIAIIETKPVEIDVETKFETAPIKVEPIKVEPIKEEAHETKLSEKDVQLSDQIVITPDIKPETKPEKIENIISILAMIPTDKAGDKKEAESEGNSLIPMIEEVENISSTSDAPAITANLTPEQITELQEYIQKSKDEGLNQEDVKALESLVAQFVVLTPPTNNAQINAQAKVERKNTEQAILQLIPEKLETAAPKELVAKDKAETKYDSRYDIRDNIRDNIRDDIRDDIKDVKAKDIKHDEAAKPEFKATLKDVAKNSSGQNFLQASGLAQNSSLAIDAATAQNAVTTNSLTQLQSSLTNITTQAQNAGANHPATQMVSVTIQKALKAGQDTNIKLRLDPPELGRVEVKMSIDKDNVTKIVLTAEKPETYMLLKQDTDILQRALSNAGLDADGNLSFELADDNHDFGNDGGRGNDKNAAGDGSDNNDLDEDLTQTVMDWQIDPQTGRMHYNVLV